MDIKASLLSLVRVWGRVSGSFQEPLQRFCALFSSFVNPSYWIFRNPIQFTGREGQGGWAKFTLMKVRAQNSRMDTNHGTYERCHVSGSIAELGWISQLFLDWVCHLSWLALVGSQYARWIGKILLSLQTSYSSLRIINWIMVGFRWPCRHDSLLAKGQFAVKWCGGEETTAFQHSISTL